ncbi:NAD(P)H dehydrogenase (quinone) [Mucilaginibacter gracilis]|uniref:NmrA family protein n=2 Tax=Mucilaginibacter TaxID=423349 RepID=H1Y486_9SPHI|nr:MULTISPECIES: SDR family oxidoreductase [Mucilaginibacter]EHQ24822.1 NmrA family protein [Mucilaginibacter paludis DSM 18603]RKR82010.1 NAD(P)H dehydrogenase (quinone) [Mucilaginibacter gracilis]
MILITGATGHFGKSTIDFLLNKGIPSTNIVALVRDEAKAEDLKAKGITIKTGDYHNYDSLTAAFKGIDKLLLVSSSDVVDRTGQHRNVVSAAKEAGVKHILYTSTERKNETASSPIHFVTGSHIETENIIIASGIPYTIFRNNLYLDMVPIFLGQQVLEKGVFLPTGETRAAFATRDDMAEATANVLITTGHENKDYGISNTENISIPEIVRSLSGIVGKEISYVSPTAEVFVETMTKAGMPEQFVGMFAGFSEAIRQGEFETDKTDLETLLGRKPVSAEEFLQGVYAAKK